MAIVGCMNKEELVELAKPLLKEIETGADRCPWTTKFLNDFIEVGPRCADRDRLISALALIERSAIPEGVLRKLTQSPFWRMVREAGLEPPVHDSGVILHQ